VLGGRRRLRRPCCCRGSAWRWRPSGVGRGRSRGSRWRAAARERRVSTTFQRPADAVHRVHRDGRDLHQRCAVCHGERGPRRARRASLNRGRPDLRAHHVALHTPATSFWWITRGKPMPASRDARRGRALDVVNYVAGAVAPMRALLGPTVQPDKAWLVAPDFQLRGGADAPGRSSTIAGARSCCSWLYRCRLAAAPRAARREPGPARHARTWRSSRCPPTPPPTPSAAGRRPPLFFPVVTTRARDSWTRTHFSPRCMT